MRMSWIKSKKDTESFRIFKGLGYPIVELEELEETDSKLKELIDNDYRTIIMSNEVAAFSEDILKKYKRAENINIIIAPSKK